MSKFCLKSRAVTVFLCLSVPAIGGAQTAVLTPLQQQQMDQNQQQAEQRAEAGLQKLSQPSPVAQQVQQEQQSLQQEQTLQAQQDQAWAEQQQANTLWQEQMNQNQDQGETPAGAAVLGAADIGGALIVRHEHEEEEQQDQRELTSGLQQEGEVLQQIRTQDALSAELDQLIARAVKDENVEQAAAADVLSVDAKFKVLTKQARRATTREQLATNYAQGMALNRRAEADLAKLHAAERDYASMRQQVDAIGQQADAINSHKP